MVQDQSHNLRIYPESYKWKVLSTVAMGSLMATMDASITNISFPVLTQVFNTELTTVMWVTVAYVLVSTCTMLLLGKISDLVGRKKIYNLGMSIFALGLILDLEALPSKSVLDRCDIGYENSRTGGMWR